MQVRDLIEALKQFDLYEEVKIEFTGNSPSFIDEDGEPAKTAKVEVEGVRHVNGYGENHIGIVCHE